MRSTSFFKGSGSPKRYNKVTSYDFKTCEEDVVCNKDNDLGSQWRKILVKWDHLITNDPNKASRLVRKGIPENMRGEAWKAFTGVRDLVRKNPGVYNLLVENAKDESVSVCIRKDINRTFPTNRKFKLKDGKGQVSLFNVLKAYATMDPVLGYCQGMSFICAILVFYMEDDDAFWALVKLIKAPEYNLSGLFSPGLPLLRLFLYILSRLIEIFLPDLFMHFNDTNVKPLLYASEWFSTLFAYNFPFELSVRIFDLFLLEGTDFLFQLCLAILEKFEEDLYEMDFEETILFMKDVGRKLDTSILEKAYEYKNVRREIKDIKNEVADPALREEIYARYCI